MLKGGGVNKGPGCGLVGSGFGGCLESGGVGEAASRSQIVVQGSWAVEVSKGLPGGRLWGQAGLAAGGGALVSGVGVSGERGASTLCRRALEAVG